MEEQEESRYQGSVPTPNESAADFSGVRQGPVGPESGRMGLHETGV